MNIRINIYDNQANNNWIAEYTIEKNGQSQFSTWISDVPVIDEESKKQFLSTIPTIVQRGLSEVEK